MTLIFGRFSILFMFPKSSSCLRLHKQDGVLSQIYLIYPYQLLFFFYHSGSDLIGDILSGDCLLSFDELGSYDRYSYSSS